MGWAERANPNSLRNLTRWHREGALRRKAETAANKQARKKDLKEFIAEHRKRVMAARGLSQTKEQG
ncbi:MAG TPA: hypothetical protein VJ553_02155 [Candidatus Paceibacterota bacterium]|nr:hypothetical protein [Candidatus Paceibacterota bacterium]